MSNGDMRRSGEDTCLVLPHTCTKALPCARTPYLKQALFKREVRHYGEDTRRGRMSNGDGQRSGEDTHLVLPHIYTKALPCAKHILFKGEVRRCV